jgi:ribokinase
LARNGINLDYLNVLQSASTGMAMIAVDGSGENFIVVNPGANGCVSVSNVDMVAERITQSSVLVMQLEIPLEAVSYAAQLANSNETTVVLNPAPAQVVDRSVLHLVDILVANQNEIGLLSGMGSPVDPASAARFLLDLGIGTVIATLGPEGAVIVTEHGEVDVPAFPVQAVDSTGAGDAFVGNLARALDAHLQLEDAVRFASAAAALSVQTEGAQPSMPYLEQTQSFLRGDYLP